MGAIGLVAAVGLYVVVPRYSPFAFRRRG
jgi:hypothetical protein